MNGSMLGALAIAALGVFGAMFGLSIQIVIAIGFASVTIAIIASKA